MRGVVGGEEHEQQPPPGRRTGARTRPTRKRPRTARYGRTSSELDRDEPCGRQRAAGLPPDEVVEHLAAGLPELGHLLAQLLEDPPRLARGDRLPGHLAAVAVLLDRPALRGEHLVDLEVGEGGVPLPEVEPAHGRDRDEGAEDEGVADRPRRDGQRRGQHERGGHRHRAGRRPEAMEPAAASPGPGAAAARGRRSARGRARSRGSGWRAPTGGPPPRPGAATGARRPRASARSPTTGAAGTPSPTSSAAGYQTSSG